MPTERPKLHRGGWKGSFWGESVIARLAGSKMLRLAGEWEEEEEEEGMSR